MKTTHPDKKFIGTYSLCPFMKMISLENTLECLQNKNSKEYEVTFTTGVLLSASKVYQNTDSLLKKAAKDV